MTNAFQPYVKRENTRTFIGHCCYVVLNVMTLCQPQEDSVGEDYYLFLKVVIREVENFQCTISPCQSQALSPPVICQCSDGRGHVLKESDTMYLELTHFHYYENKTKHTQTGGLLLRSGNR